MRVVQRLRRRHAPRRHVGEHGGQHEGVEHLAFGRVGRPGVPDVRRPLQGGTDRLELGGWVGAERVVRRGLLEPALARRGLLPLGRARVGHGARIRGEVVELASRHGVAVMPDEVEQELLRHVGALRELPDGVDPHHVLARPPRPPRPLQCRDEEDVVGHRQLVVLRGAIGGDGVEDVRRLAGVQRLIVRRGVPAQHRRVHPGLVQALREVQGLERVVRLQDHVLIGVLDRAVVRPQHRPCRHVGIELLRHPDADRDLDLRVLRLDLRPRRDEVLPGGRAVGLPDLRPDALQVIAGIGDIVVAEAEPFPRHRIVGAALAQVDQRPMLAFGFLHDVCHVEHLWLERPRRR